MKYLGQPQSGSSADTTASHNRAGQYLRNRRTPVTPTRTPKQGILRGRFADASAAWQSLDSTLQNAWTSFAHNYPTVDALGQSVVLTGQQYFIGIQTSRLNAGQDMNFNVPTNTSIPSIDTPVLDIASDGTITVSVASIAPGDFVIVGCSKVLSNGVNFNQSFSQFAVLDSTQLSVDITDVYEAQYGHAVGGRKIFARFKCVNSSGMTGPDLIIQTAVPVGNNVTLVIGAGNVQMTQPDGQTVTVQPQTATSQFGPWTNEGAPTTRTIPNDLIVPAVSGTYYRVTGTLPDGSVINSDVVVG